MKLYDMLGQIGPNDNNIHHVTIDPTWHQGRTAFGGISTALAYSAARQCADNLPPLLSAQIAFSGPIAGDVSIKTQILRRGRNAAFIRADIITGDSVGLSCTFLFVTRRPSKIDFSDMAKPHFPPIPADEDLRSGPPEFFTGHLQYPDKRLILGQGEAKLANWHRFKPEDMVKADKRDPFAEILCIGDGLPPSVMGLFTEPAMVSSMNWQVNMLTDTPETDKGWWFLQSDTHHAQYGASSQNMSVWNSKHEPIMTAMQSVALFV